MQMLLDSPSGEQYIESLRRHGAAQGYETHLLEADDRFPHYPIGLRQIAAVLQWRPLQLTREQVFVLRECGGPEQVLLGAVADPITTFLRAKQACGIALDSFERQVLPRIGTFDELYALILVKKDMRVPLTRYEDRVRSLNEGGCMNFRKAKAEALRLLTAHRQVEEVV